MTIKFNVPRTDSKGNVIKDPATNKPALLSDLIGDFLGTETKGNVRKLGGWIELLADGKPLELDDADLKMFTELVENTERMWMIAKAQIFKIIDGVKK